MKIRLLAPARIKFNAGDVVEASPAQADFLLSIGNATLVEEKQETKIETAVEEKAETPEVKKATRRSTRK